MPSAYSTVPTPIVPPNSHPHETTIISIVPLISAIEKPVFFCKPVINPSLGPGPNLAIKYIPLPKPTINTETIHNKNWLIQSSGAFKKYIVMSIMIAMIIKFNIVPIPIFSSKKNHSNKTIKLIKKAHEPTDNPRFKARPWCKTFQGEAPIVEIISKPSPKPNIIKPKHNKNRVLKEGLRFLGDFELQDSLGIFFIFKNIDLFIKCTKYTQSTY